MSRCRLRFCALIALLPLMAAAGVENAANAQEMGIVELYQTRRMVSRASAQSFFRIDALPPAPLVVAGSMLPTRADQPATTPTPSDQQAVNVFHVRRVPRFAHSWFSETFSDVEWAYEGGNTLAPLDTMLTREIRARLESEFGAPTRTLADNGALSTLKLDEYVQFEYWFLVNGDWPIVIMDVNGPFERGVVVSGRAEQRESLIDIRNQILEPILKSPKRAPFTDYFFEQEIGEWYLTGFDGRSYFLEPVNPRRVIPGRPSVRSSAEPVPSENQP